MKKNRGFSLLELLIVVVIASALLLLLVPNVSPTLQIWRLDGSASMIHNKVMEARMNAIKRNRQAWLSIDSTAGQVQVQTTDDTPVTINVGDPGLLQQRVTFQTGAPNEVRFDSMGRPTAARTIVIETTDRSKTIIISAMGRVTVS